MTGQLGCGEAVRRLWEFLDRGLDRADRRAVEEHLALCVRCCGELEFAKEVRRKLRGADGAMPTDARGRLERFIDGLGELGDATGRGTIG